jgi:hypothetical protein
MHRMKQPKKNATGGIDQILQKDEHIEQLGESMSEGKDWRPIHLFLSLCFPSLRCWHHYERLCTHASTPPACRLSFILHQPSFTLLAPSLMQIFEVTSEPSQTCRINFTHWCSTVRHNNLGDVNSPRIRRRSCQT